jgi:hypothetical protein
MAERLFLVCYRSCRDDASPSDRANATVEYVVERSVGAACYELLRKLDQSFHAYDDAEVWNGLASLVSGASCFERWDGSNEFYFKVWAVHDVQLVPYAMKVTLTRLVGEAHLNWEDRKLGGEYTFIVNAANVEHAKSLALDEFHVNVPVNVLDDFEIDVDQCGE